MSAVVPLLLLLPVGLIWPNAQVERHEWQMAQILLEGYVRSFPNKRLHRQRCVIPACRVKKPVTHFPWLAAVPIKE